MTLSPKYTYAVSFFALAWCLIWLLDGAVGFARAGETTFEEDMIRLYQQMVPATVSVASAYSTGRPSGTTRMMGQGSGFIVDESGIVLTNAHVVEGASKIAVMLHDGQRMSAKLMGSDPATDIAVLRLEAVKGKLATLRLGDSSRLHVGQRTLVVGNTLGLGITLSNGIISRIGYRPAGIRYTDAEIIQTTAAINPGNSGGPMADSSGEVIGIATAVLEGAQNVGFAIPINTVTQVLAEIKEKGRVVRPWLGVEGKFVTPEIKDLFTLPLSEGLLLEHVAAGSPADEAGFQAGDLDVLVEGEAWILGGDILVAIHGHPIRVPQDFVQALSTLPVGQKVEIQFLRDGKAQRTSAVIRERPRKLLHMRGARGTRPTAAPSPSIVEEMSRIAF